jgi:dTMP kinase
MLNGKNGLMIVIEGFEGVGKTTQTQLLKERLIAIGHKTISVREPGGTDSNESIRRVIMEHGTKMPTESLVNLFIACKKNLLDQVIHPALRDNTTVVMDRYTPSLMAYQTASGQIHMSQIDSMLYASRARFEPDVYFYLHAPYDTIIARLNNRNQGSDEFEEKQLAHAKVICEKYEHYFTQIQHDCKIVFINANQSIEQVEQQIWSELIKLYPKISQL